MITRDPIYQALFDRLRLSAGFITTDRVLRHWNDVKPADQPALFMTPGSESAVAALGRPTRWSLSVRAYLYVRTEKGTVPATVLSALIDAIEQSLAPDATTGQQTLGGMCRHCYLTGVEHDEGLLGQQGVAIVSLAIEAV